MAAQQTPPSLPPPTRPDEQLYWLDLTVDHTWDLRLNRPFDRAVGGEVNYVECVEGVGYDIRRRAVGANFSMRRD